MKNVLFSILAAVGILATGCTRDPKTETNSESTTGSLRITIVNEAGNSTRATGTIDAKLENTVFNFAAFVFRADGTLEKAKVFDSFSDQSDISGEIKDLSVSTPKKLVVMANHSFNFINNIQKLDDLNELSLNFDSQIPVNFSSSGLFMSGLHKDNVTLEAGKENRVTVEIARVVSKVEIGSLTVKPTDDYDLKLFRLDSIGIQKVPSLAYVMSNNIYKIDLTDPLEFYYGGLSGGSVSKFLKGLSEGYTLSEKYNEGEKINPELYFYVFPNDNSQDNATMLSIYAHYDNKPLYYNFVINNESSAEKDGTDGTYITRNKRYILHVTLNRLGVGSSEPDSIEQFADMTVEVQVVGWEGPLNQNLVW